MKTRWREASAVDAQNIRVVFDIPGLEKTRRLKQWQWEALVRISQRLHLPFDFDRRDQWGHIVPQGIVLNAGELSQWQYARQELQGTMERLAEVEEEARSLREKVSLRPRFQVLDREVVRQWCSTLNRWDEVVESGLGGEELGAMAPRFALPPDAQMGVRLQPVRFRKWVAGRELWALTPPMSFVLFNDRILAQQAGHPHVYAADMKLCVGNATFDYGNPFQVMGMLREWYVGYNPRDVADKSWPEFSKMWWRAEGEKWLEREDSWVLEAPDAERERSELRRATREEVARWCGNKGWVSEPLRSAEAAPVAQPPRMEARERYAAWMWRVKEDEDREGVVCAMEPPHPAHMRLQGNPPDSLTIQTISLCACHAAELGHPMVHQNLLNPAEAEEVGENGRRCEAEALWMRMPQASGLATYAYEGLRLCAGHALLLRGGVLPRAQRNLNTKELDQLILSGELGCGQAQNATAYLTLFSGASRLQHGWLTPCAECGEELQKHWGLACPRSAPYRLPAGHAANRLGIEAWSKWDFGDAEANTHLEVEIAAWRAHFAAKPKDTGHGDRLAQLVRRLSALDGTKLDEPGGQREHWVEDALRKFGRSITSSTRCVDCGAPWLEHVGPDCSHG